MVKEEDPSPSEEKNLGQVITKLKNRAWRRNWKNRAQMEGKPSKKWFTTKRRRK